MKDQFIGSGNKNTTNKFRYFLESNFAGVKRLFVLVVPNEDVASKRFKAKRYYLPKGPIDQPIERPIDSDIKLYKEVRKLTRGQREYYTTGCLVDDDYIKNQYKLLAFDIIRQKN